MKNLNLENFYNEFSSQIYDIDDNILYDSYSYPSHGVELDVLDDNNLKLIYKGSLARSESKDLIAVVDYVNNKIKNSESVPMTESSPHTFELKLPVKDSRCMNISFKDNKDNLDDNSGRKYVFCTHLFKKIPN